mgnify:CR=1 FL=1
MAVPKKKTSKARSRKRYANWKRIAGPTLVECPQCHELRIPHRVCPECGHYKDREVVDMSK